MRHKLPTALASLALVLSGVVLAAAPARNWNAVVSAGAADSYVLGNPQAQVRLVEYISYTCPHCAHFEQEADAPLRLHFIATGKLAVEVRHYVRDPVDMTVALLTHCGPPGKFFLNHAAFLRSQASWIKPMTAASEAQRARWTTGTFTARTSAIARDFHFHDIMRTRGYPASQVNACLANEALADRLAQGTAAARETLGVIGTPSFVIDGVLLAATYDWDTLRPQLEARM